MATPAIVFVVGMALAVFLFIWFVLLPYAKESNDEAVRQIEMMTRYYERKATESARRYAKKQQQRPTRNMRVRAKLREEAGKPFKRFVAVRRWSIR